MAHYLEKLNSAQRQAVEYGKGPILILAGAGSGKTRVLTNRIVHLIEKYAVNPTQIFAVTFTNKAAAEMRERVFHLLQGLGLQLYRPDDLWVSTFHSACVRILRYDIRHLGWSSSFTIYDDSDQLSVVKAVMKELNIAEQMISPKSIQGKINKVKNDGVDAQGYKPTFGGPIEDAFCRVFLRYEEVLKASSAVDFADLILLTVKLFREVPQVLAQYQQRFPYLFIDEYQDTNRCQYQLMRLLAGTQANICAVGDEDQSIYKWRGADISNILNFEKDYPTAQIFKLEQNYRSTKNIIEAASHVISFNTERRDKELWTDNSTGDPILVQECYDEHDEAQKVVESIESHITEGNSLQEMSIFYRTNAQSRVLEDLLRGKGINYQIYGGLKFYDRLEVKDTLAYLKLLSNSDDDVSFRRIVNVPGRGIGAVSLERLTEKARSRGVSLYKLLKLYFDNSLEDTSDLGRAKKSFHQFYEIMETLQKNRASLLPSDLISAVIEQTGYRESLTKEATIESQARLENLSELRQSVVEYELRTAADNPTATITLEGFLEQVALVSGIDKFDATAPALKMMTIHMAKGLEFDFVFIAGLEEELFPNVRSWDVEDQADVEEERRLFYVGMTRARKRLHLFYAKNRTVFGTTHFRVRSRFLDEIPETYLENKKADYFARRRQYLDRPGLYPFKQREENPDSDFNQVNEWSDDPAPASDGDEPEFKRGTRVLHPMFGEGIVRSQMGGDKVVVEFPGRGLKKISLKFTQLKLI